MENTGVQKLVFRSFWWNFGIRKNFTIVFGKPERNFVEMTLFCPKTGELMSLYELAHCCGEVSSRLMRGKFGQMQEILFSNWSIMPLYEGRLENKFPYFSLDVLWTDQCEIAGRYNFWVSGNTVKITRQSLHKNVQNGVLKMELPLHVVASCEVCTLIYFSPAQNKSAIEIQ